MAYYRKNKRRFDPRYFLSERMEEELEERVSTDPAIGKGRRSRRSIMDLPSAEEDKEDKDGDGETTLAGEEEASQNYENNKDDEDEVKEEGCGEPVEVEVEEEPGFSFTGDVGDLGGDEAFGVGWNAALDRVSSMVGELIAEMETEDEDADPVGDMAGEPLPQLVGEPHLEE